MDIKDLNKGQFLLLVILICFIVSIATSVATYAILNEAPDDVRRPITQVVQKTVERIVEIENNSKNELSKEEALLLEDLKALKPLLDKLAEQQDTTSTENTTTTTTEENNTDNTNTEPLPENPNP